MRSDHNHTSPGQNGTHLENPANPLQMILIGSIRLYQVTLSSVLGPTCRYSPSCSAYALEAVRTHGALRGFWLALKRIGRCHPWSEGGFDPVPPAVHSFPSMQEHPGRHGK